MLDAISCWRVDWTAIGAVATAAAVFASLLIAGNEKRRRKEYAKFLLEQDFVVLTNLVSELNDYAGYLSSYFSDHDVDKDDEERHSNSITKIVSQLQYFGHSEQLFSYQEQTEAFANLSKAVSSASCVLDTSISVWRREHDEPELVLVGFINRVAEDLDGSITAYRVEKGNHKSLRSWIKELQKNRLKVAA